MVARITTNPVWSHPTSGGLGTRDSVSGAALPGSAESTLISRLQHTRTRMPHRFHQPSGCTDDSHGYIDIITVSIHRTVDAVTFSNRQPFRLV